MAYITRPNVVSRGGGAGGVLLDSRDVASHCNDGDIVVINGAGAISPAAANAATIYGVTSHDSDANYGGVPGNVTPPLLNALGRSIVNTPLFPPDPAQSLVGDLRVNDAEINLSAVTGWISGGTYQANVGTLCGIAIDPATGFYVLDPNASNKLFVIDEYLYEPFPGQPANGAGALNVRVRAHAIPTALEG